MNLFKKWVRHAPRAPFGARAFLRVEVLESRVVPYALSGGAWPNPQLITISFVPDGTNLGGVYSNLFATFNAKWSTQTWENVILKAAQQWAAATNINFAVVADNGAPSGSGNYEQGDPGMGDIRIGGFNYGTGDLAGTAYPPQVNNFSIAGDMDFNTGMTFNIGTTYDLFSVAMHEFGHAIGLEESNAYGSVMNAAYHIRTGLGTDDIAGARAIYSAGLPRSTDAYLGLNNSFLTATSVVLNDTTGQVDNLNLAKAGQAEYFSVIAPTDTTGSLTVNVQSAGLSLLAPTVTLYNASDVQIGYASGAGQDGTTISVTTTGVSPLQLFYVKVTGADTSAFSTGAYAVTFNFGAGSSPVVPLPNTETPNGSPLHAGGGSPQLVEPTTANVNFAIPFDPNHVNGISQVAAAGGVVRMLNSASTQNATLLQATAQNSAGQAGSYTDLAANSSTASAPLLPTTLGTRRIESGGGQAATTQVGLQPAEVLLAPGSDRTSPATTTQSDDEPETTTSTMEWRDASTAWFADGAVAGQSMDDVPGLASDVGAGFDSAAMLLGSAVLLGAYWGGQPDEIPENKTRKARLP